MIVPSAEYADMSIGLESGVRSARECNCAGAEIVISFRPCRIAQRVSVCHVCERAGHCKRADVLPHSTDPNRFQHVGVTVSPTDWPSASSRDISSIT